jgi:nicotinamide mononucleotide transporter
VAATEIAAVAFGIAYILFAIRERRDCWIAGGISTAIYAVVFFDAGLPMQAVLQLVYVAMSIYGWLAWGRDAGKSPPPASLGFRMHLLALFGIAIATAVSVPLVARFAPGALPLADSLGAWASLYATWLLACRYIDTWPWWVVIDAGLATLFASQGLWPTAALYLAYSLLAVAGWKSWRQSRVPAT